MCELTYPSNPDLRVTGWTPVHALEFRLVFTAFQILARHDTVPCKSLGTRTVVVQMMEVGVLTRLLLHTPEPRLSRSLLSVSPTICPDGWGLFLLVLRILIPNFSAQTLSAQMHLPWHHLLRRRGIFNSRPCPASNFRNE